VDTSFIRQQVLMLYRGRHGGAPSEQGFHSAGDSSTALRMMVQGRGWPHRVQIDGGDVLRSPYVMTPSWPSVRSAAVRSSRLWPSFFEGRSMEEGQEWVAQCHGKTPATLHSTRTTLGIASQWRVVRTTPGARFQLTVDCRIKVHMDLQVDKSPVVVKGPFFP
jgi:hypothetical protein